MGHETPRDRAYCPMHRRLEASCEYCTREPSPYPHRLLARQQLEVCRTFFALEENAAIVHTMKNLLKALHEQEVPALCSRIIWGQDRAAMGRVGANGYVGLLELPEDAEIVKQLSIFLLGNAREALLPFCEKLSRDWMQDAIGCHDQVPTIAIERSLKADRAAMVKLIQEHKDLLSPEEKLGWTAAFEAFWNHYSNEIRQRCDRKSPSYARLDGVILSSVDKASRAFWEVYRERS